MAKPTRERKYVRITVRGIRKEVTKFKPQILYEAEFRSFGYTEAYLPKLTLLRRSDTSSFHDFGLNYEKQYTSEEILEIVQRGIQSSKMGYVNKINVSLETCFEGEET
jgi:hypothetical protein